MEFNNETTVTMSHNHLALVSRIEDWYNIKKIIGDLMEKHSLGLDIRVEISKLRGWAYCMYLGMLGELTRHKLTKYYSLEQLEKDITEGDYETILKAVKQLFEVADDLNITKVDTGRKYDTTRVMAEYKAKRGLNP